MGNLPSFLGGQGADLPSQMMNWISGTLYDRFIHKQINDEEEFCSAILDIFNDVNMALPGKHYDAPARQEIEKLYNDWKSTTDEGKLKYFKEFIIEKVNLSKADESMMITGLVAPPVAMVAKKTGQSVPQISGVIKVIPDVVFVPAATIASLIVAKLLFNRMAFKDIPS
ncbi:hypothetical protein Fmac_028884 [Flemingia macrophylla]|uniref:Calcium ion-binding protein n=1 Tax=Flemingia macrophylla TaxID=520843 RepID=A0ABD1L8S3_9FABA